MMVDPLSATRRLAELSEDRIQETASLSRRSTIDIEYQCVAVLELISLTSRVSLGISTLPYSVHSTLQLSIRKRRS